MYSISVVVPTLAGGHRLARLLASLARQSAEHEVVVVDNGSDGDAVVGVLGEFPEVTHVRLQRNAGFGRAVNVGAQRASGMAIVLVNDDCVCEPRFVERIAASLDPVAGLTMAAGVMRSAAEPSLIDTAGIEIDATLFAFDYLNGEPLEALTDPDLAPPFGPSGCAAAFDRDAFERVGGFDERLFAYLEDVDLAIRMRLDGGTCGLARDGLGTHEHSATLGSGSPRKNYLLGFARGYLIRKWGVATASRFPGLAVREGALCAGQILFDHTTAGWRGRLDGYRSGPVVNPYPRDALTAGPEPPSAVASLRRRLRRRRRLDRPASSISSKIPSRVLVAFHVAEISGPLRSLEPHLQWLAEHGDVTALLPDDGPGRERLGRFAEVRVADYEALTLPRARDLLRAMPRLAADRGTFRRAIRDVRPELVISVSAMLPSLLSAARTEGVPALMYAGEFLMAPRQGSRARKGMAGALLGYNRRMAAGVMACSELVAGQYSRADALELMMPPIDGQYSKGDGSGFRRAHGVPPAAPCVATVGSLSAGRGQDVLVDSVARLTTSVRDLHCLIVGDPHPRAQDIEFAHSLRGLAEALGIADRVVFTGQVDRIADVYAASDVLANPARITEGFGRIAFEAAMAGRAMVATDLSVILRDGESALLVPSGDPEALARGIERILRDDDLAMRLAAGARDFALRELTEEASQAHFEILLRRVLG